MGQGMIVRGDVEGLAFEHVSLRGRECYNPLLDWRLFDVYR
jgi:hypothetical protein